MLAAHFLANVLQLAGLGVVVGAGLGLLMEVVRR